MLFSYVRTLESPPVRERAADSDCHMFCQFLDVICICFFPFGFLNRLLNLIVSVPVVALRIY